MNAMQKRFEMRPAISERDRLGRVLCNDRQVNSARAGMQQR